MGSTLSVNGILTDKNGLALNDKTVILSYAVGNSASWTQIGSGKTNSAGEFTVQWLIAASGTFTLKTEWTGDQNHAGSSNTTTLSFLPYQEQKVFFVESNSTVTGLAFNSTSLTLSFAVTGPSGTKGYTKVTVAKTIVSNVTGIIVSLDGKELTASISSTNEYWIITFTYSHSTHQVTLNLNDHSSSNSVPEFPSWTIPLLLSIIVAFAGLLVYFKKRHTQNVAVYWPCQPEPTKDERRITKNLWNSSKRLTIN